MKRTLKSVFVSAHFRVYKSHSGHYVVASLNSSCRFGSYKAKNRAIARVAELELDLVVAELSALADLWLLPELVA